MGLSLSRLWHLKRIESTAYPSPIPIQSGEPLELVGSPLIHTGDQPAHTTSGTADTNALDMVTVVSSTPVTEIDVEYMQQHLATLKRKVAL